MPFPFARDEAGWDALCGDDAALAPGVAALCVRHGLGGRPVQRFDSGSLPVYAVGAGHVLKLFPPSGVEHASIEARCLAALQGALPIPTPRLLAADSLDGWHGVLMTRLSGSRLVEVWPALSSADRDRLADTLGQSVAALHAIDTRPLAGFTPDWDSFLPAQRASAAERQRAGGLETRWVDRIDAYLTRWMPPPDPRRVLLHTELMREHLMIDGAAGQAYCSGVFDFEPAMIGAPEYDFASFGLFVACGDGRFLRRALLAYGYRPDQLDEDLQYRLLAYALLHRYSKLRWYLERLPAPQAVTLEHLAAQWWPLH